MRRKGGYLYYNYMKFPTKILMDVADAKLKLMYVDVGAKGDGGDEGTWCKCNLHHTIEQNRVGFPDDSTLLNDDTPIPFHKIADDAFALRTMLIKPYSHTSQAHHKKFYSYMLCHARCVVENAFVILQMRFKILGTTIQQSPKVVELITMC
ncbi:uncharacterized protein [Palaemon carinicauda]|uniref:uncharacterized protein n=1 Tax=Palaemon carinicauda TaxID=392227 RepID=UPI0035B65998